MNTDSFCGGGRCVPWLAFPDATDFAPDCADDLDSIDVPLTLPDLTVSVDPVVECLSHQQSARISVSLCNRGPRELPGGQAAVVLVDAAEPSRSLCELVAPNVLRPGSCETLNCDVDVPFLPSGFDIAILADPTDGVPECSEGANNSALLSNVFCGRDPE